MLLALLSPLIGLLGSVLPALIRIWERKQDLQHEIELNKLKIEAAREQGNIDFAIESVKADVAEGDSLRKHDSALDGGKFINALRASIRPVITYIFFFLFCGIKVTALVVMIREGVELPEMLKAIWDAETGALFSTIIAFWFGTRMLDRRLGNNNRQSYILTTKGKK